MNIVCSHCNQEFTASKKQNNFISISKQKNMTFIMLECALCKKNFSLNPITMCLPDPQTMEIGDGLLCPKQKCSGIISYIKDNPDFWGCGECGNIWFKLEDLYLEIHKRKL